ncbi:hypothetical protein DOJK_02335 [Patescibacteria group bacterium]|nr:SufD family Fe-S cluster assembly protein [Candidatus Dojkabacteria bacterium]CAG1023431.1 hypothetical protein DOJK_02335 [Patescibacteria group bacterium]
MKKIEINFDKPEQIIEVTSDSEITGRFIGKDGSSVKCKITILHKKPNLKSRVNIKAVVFDHAKFDFEGMLRIEKGATGTDTYLKIDCLVMNENACARAIPSLEILESEVKGGHGATIGYLDPYQLYYLKSHGLSKKTSEDVLVEAFLS